MLKQNSNNNMIKIRYMTKDKPNGVCVSYELKGQVIEPLGTIVVHTESSREKMSNKDITDPSNVVVATGIRAGNEVIVIPEVPISDSPLMLTHNGTDVSWKPLMANDANDKGLIDKITMLETCARGKSNEISALKEEIADLKKTCDYLSERITSIEQKFVERIEILETVIGNFRDTELYTPSDFNSTVEASELRLSTAKDIIKKSKPIFTGDEVSVNGTVSQLLGALCKLQVSQK